MWQKPEIEKIFRLFPAASESLPKGDSLSVEKLNEVSQKYFLRPKGEGMVSPNSVKHYVALVSHLNESQQSELMGAFTTLGMINTIEPKTSNPDYILIHGTDLQIMRQRLMFVANLIRANYLSSTPEIIFLSGDRPFSQTETEAALKDPAPYLPNP